MQWRGLIQALHVSTGCSGDGAGIQMGFFYLSIVPSAFIVAGPHFFLAFYQRDLQRSGLQFFLIIADFLPLVLTGRSSIHGYA